MIKASNLSFSYTGRSPALREVDLDLSEGLILGLVGANGGGKSTLLSLLAGLFVPTSGRLEVFGRSDPRGLRNLSGLVMQDSDLQIIGSTVGEDLSLGLEGEAAEAEARAMAERFDLLELWDQPVQTLSWGRKKRLCLAAVLVKKPQLVLLDEPFSGLDYPGILEMRRLLADNRRAGLTQIAAAHDLEPLADLADRWLVLDRGRAVLTGTGPEVFDRLAEYSVRPPCSWQAGLGIRAWDWGHEA